jgi:hypothetical protein
MSKLTVDENAVLLRAGFTQREINTQGQKFHSLFRIEPFLTHEVRDHRVCREQRDELLEALEGMIEMVEMNGFGKAYAMDIARAAITKAGGQA